MAEFFTILDRGITGRQRVHIRNNHEPAFVYTGIIERIFFILFMNDFNDFFGGQYIK